MGTLGEEWAERIREEAAIVRDARRSLAEGQGQLVASRGEWERQNAALIEGVKAASEWVQAAETALRSATVDAYRATGVVNPGPGVAIRHTQRVCYDPKNALAWARNTGLFLNLDSRGFEKFARTQPGQVPFVELVDDLQATIATDLGKALAEAGPAGDEELPF